MQNLIAHIKKSINLSPLDCDAITSGTKLINLKKKDFLLEEGRICKANYFVSKGCLRMFFINHKGVEQITQFAIENWWISDYMSFSKQTASLFYIQAVEDSDILALSLSDQEHLLTKVPKLERYFRLNMQRALGAAQQRVKFSHDFSKEESYRHFIASFPSFVQRIPQYMLASYLGLTPEYLSELRKKD
ncbi:MAG: Crp/Fnr family transcriptional regulator [Pedobacter sp.]|nr:MAG: Crp/Fnr family transcriptional regulator [Pedobacter sp.]